MHPPEDLLLLFFVEIRSAYLQPTTRARSRAFSIYQKKFRKFRLGCKWSTTFWFVPLEIFQIKRNSFENVVPFSRWKRPNGKFVFHLQISRLYHQFHAICGLLSGQASLMFQQKWRLIMPVSVFWKLSGLLRVLCLPRSSADLENLKVVGRNSCLFEAFSPVHVCRVKQVARTNLKSSFVILRSQVKFQPL